MKDNINNNIENTIQKLTITEFKIVDMFAKNIPIKTISQKYHKTENEILDFLSKKEIIDLLAETKKGFGSRKFRKNFLNSISKKLSDSIMEDLLDDSKLKDITTTAKVNYLKTIMNIVQTDEKETKEDTEDVTTRMMKIKDKMVSRGIKNIPITNNKIININKNEEK